MIKKFEWENKNGKLDRTALPNPFDIVTNTI